MFMVFMQVETLSGVEGWGWKEEGGHALPQGPLFPHQQYYYYGVDECVNRTVGETYV